MGNQSTNRKKSTIKVDIFVSCLLALTLISGYKKIQNVAADTFGSEYLMQNGKSNNGQQVFGFNTSNYHMSSFVVENGDILGNILSENGVTADLIGLIEAKAKDIFSVTKIRKGKEYHIVKTDSCGRACALIYEPSPLHYVIYDFRDSVTVSVREREFETCTEMASGEITSNLWTALEDQGVNPSIIDKMEEALASSVDFYHTQKGDQFKLIFEKKYVDGEEIGIGQLVGASYKNDNGTFYSVFYENGEFKGYYDYKGRAAKSSFLKSPVKFTRISSGYNLRRFHPIRRMTIPHLGTDYAAPYGTPIRAVSDGVVEEAAYTGNNGRYVKIKHDKTYQSQYLHMQGFAGGMRKGKRVQQGETIGYVGATGLATGPHVCFRFWKNGRQINHLRENFEPSKPLPDHELPKFFEHRDKIKQLIDQMPTLVKNNKTDA